MSITLTNTVTQLAPEDRENISVTAPASAIADILSVVGYALPQGGLPEEAWSRFSQVFSAANTRDAGASAREEVLASDDKAADETWQDTILPAMALPLMPVMLNLPLSVNLPSMSLQFVAGNHYGETSASTTDSMVLSTAATQGSTAQPRETAPLNLNLPMLTTVNGSNLPDSHSNSGSLTARGNIRAMAEVSQAVSDSPPLTAKNDSGAGDLPVVNGDTGEPALSNRPGGATLSNDANANLWSSAAAGIHDSSVLPEDTVKLAGPPSQWQQSLREALGERLQIRAGRNSEQAVIRLDPPMLGRIEISIRHEAGALQVTMSASNTEVLRQLHGIGDSLRQDLSHRQYTDVAVVVSASRSSSGNNGADTDGRQRQGSGGGDQDENLPGRALADLDQTSPGFALLTDREA